MKTATIKLENITGFDIEINGKIYPIYRDVCTEHDQAIHERLGTANEIELQRFLDCCYYGDWFDSDGHYLNRDEAGLGLV